MNIVGVDLSGPSNIVDTCLVYFEDQGDRLFYLGALSGADDQQIYNLVSNLASETSVVIGLDAPLSYNITGGDRPADAELRQEIIKAGLHPGSIMPPTMTRMVYLTLRGIALARCLESLSQQPVYLVEVHPGAALALHGAPIEVVTRFKRDLEARIRLLDWLEDQHLESITDRTAPTDHYVAACAAALAAWKWNRGSLLGECRRNRLFIPTISRVDTP